MYPPVTQFETRDLELQRQLRLANKRYRPEGQPARRAAYDRLKTTFRRNTPRPRFEPADSESPT
jgi:hypothetical protein